MGNGGLSIGKYDNKGYGYAMVAISSRTLRFPSSYSPISEAGDWQVGEYCSISSALFSLEVQTPWQYFLHSVPTPQ